MKVIEQLLTMMIEVRLRSSPAIRNNRGCANRRYSKKRDEKRLEGSLTNRMSKQTNVDDQAKAGDNVIRHHSGTAVSGIDEEKSVSDAYGHGWCCAGPRWMHVIRKRFRSESVDRRGM